MSTWTSTPTALPFVVLLALSVGCPGSLENPDRFGGGSVDGGNRDAGGTFECATPIFQNEAKCAGSVCHDSNNPSAGLDLSVSGLGAMLRDRPAAAVADFPEAACEGEGNLIDTANPMESLLYTKISADTNPCGTQMPIGPALTAEEVDCIRDWVLDQAM